ncbi:MAG: VWA domain-containing protein [Magnetococcus sp. DMHC-6]
MNGELFHFIRPLWLWAALPALFLIFLLWRQWRAGEEWQNFIDPHLLPHLLQGTNPKKSHGWLAVLALAWWATVLALAGPAWEKIPQPVYRPHNPLIVVLDLSSSMQAQDIRPSRLLRAKQKVHDILEKNQGGQIGLVVFAGDGFILSPPTDAQAIVPLLEAMEPNIMPIQGQLPYRGLEIAGEMFTSSGLGKGHLILITSGDEAPSKTLETVRKLTESGHRLSILGVGTRQGAPIPLEKGAFMKDSQGKVLLAQLQVEPLRALAQLGHGLYTEITPDDQDIDQLLAKDPLTLTKGITETERAAPVWREEGPWLFLLILPLAALAFRRGWLFVAVLICSFCTPQPALAFSWSDLWQRPDQQGAQALANGDAKKAATLFTNPEWQGVAHYQDHNLQEAAQAFGQHPTADSYYNKGNALTGLGQYPQALAAYEQALKLNPNHADARANQKLVQQIIEKEPPPPPQKSSDDNAQDEKKKEENTKKEENSQNNKQKSEPKKEESDAQKESSQPDTAKPQASSPSQPEKEPHSQHATAQEEPSTPETPPPSAQEKREQQEMEQSTEQWLQRIPDDPAGLFRRKFLLEYRRRQGNASGEQP